MIIYDDLLRIIDRSYIELGKGGSREDAIKKISTALKLSQKSLYKKEEEIIADLNLTIEKARKLSFYSKDIIKNPSNYLMETIFPKNLIYRENNKSLVKTIKEKKYQFDPVTILIMQYRKSIPSLITLLYS